MSKKSSKRVVIPELEDAPLVRNDFWSVEDKIVVASYYGIKATSSIAKYLNRTPPGVQNTAARLDITSRSTDEEREEVIRKIEAGEL